MLLAVFGCLPALADAQQLANLSHSELPDAPGWVQVKEAHSTEPPRGTGNISGTVLDIDESMVPNARVTLVEEGNFAERTTVSDGEGNFIFSDLAGGRFKIIITSPGLKTFVSSEIILHPGEHHELARIALPLAVANVDVQVTVTQVEIAQEQIELQEKQRLFGVLPNFYSSYIWDAAPLTTKQKFTLAGHSILDPVVFVVTGIAAGIEQANNTFPAYGQGTKGYAKRYFADYGDELSNRMISSAILPVVFHQDPRYFYKGTGSKRSRALYAVSRALITRGDDGRSKPNYSHILGAFAAGAISNTYHEGSDRGTGLLLRNGFIAIGGHAADNLLREFLFKHLTPNVPNYEKGEPLSISEPAAH
ncbi:MAG: carboxypeptidase-like regulatory domain-containing protein [Granulicella sp.]